MIEKRYLNKVIKLAKKYDIGRLYLIGSSLYKKPHEIKDYDFAIAKFPPANFFKFYAELFATLPKNVDLISLSGKATTFKKIVAREGKLLYEKRTD